MRVVAFEEIADALLSPYACEDLIDPALPVLAVDVSGAVIDAQATATLEALPTVTLAVADTTTARAPDGLAAFDLLLATGAPEPVPSGETAVWTGPDDGVDAAIEAIADRVRANPQASVAAAQLLRLSAGLDVVRGLIAESLTYSTLQAGPELEAWLRSRGPTSEAELDPFPLVVERVGDELRVSFNRPEIRNAFGHEVRDALVEALQLAAADDSIGAITLSGRGPDFCSGGDLREFGTFADPVGAHLIRTTRSAGYWIHRLADRITAQVHGACIGAGIELPAFAGRVTATPDTRISLPEVAMGLVPGAGGTVSLPRRIGRHRTAYLCLSGATIGAETAHAWGLVDELG